MKKNTLIVLIVLCLIIALVGALAACDTITDKVKDAIQDNDTDNSDTNNTNDPSGSTASFDYQATAAERQVETMRQSSGFKIKYVITDTAEEEESKTIAVGAKGNVYYALDDSYEYYYDFTNETYCVMYEKDGAGTWRKNTYYYDDVYTKDLQKGVMDAIINANSIWMTYYDGFASSMDGATKTTATVLGRTCDKYTFSAAALSGVGISVNRAAYSCYIDKETSICLKWEYTVTVDGKSETWCVECIEFNTNPTFTFPTVSAENTRTFGTPSGSGSGTGTGESGSGSGSGTGESGSGTGTGESGSGTSEGGSGTGESGTTDTVTLASRASIIDAIGETYKVVAQSPYGAVTTVASDGTYFYAKAPTETFNKKIGDTYLYPYSYAWDGKYHRMGTPTYSADGSAPTMLGRGNVGNIFQFADEELVYNTAENVTFLGRSAKKYTFESTNAYGYDMYFHEEVIIDDETGACLKYYGEGRGTSSGTRNKNNFEVTEFEYGYENDAALSFLDGYIAKIDVYAWEEDFMESLGLSYVDAPMGDLWYSEWEDSDHSDRDSDAPYWNAKYVLYSDTQAEYQDYVEGIMRAFYDAGAKIDGSSEQDFEDLFWDNSGDDDRSDIGFAARIVGNTDYIVYVAADYNKHLSPLAWRIEIEIKYDAE